MTKTTLVAVALAFLATPVDGESVHPNLQRFRNHLEKHIDSACGNETVTGSVLINDDGTISFVFVDDTQMLVIHTTFAHNNAVMYHMPHDAPAFFKNDLVLDEPDLKSKAGRIKLCRELGEMMIRFGYLSQDSSN